MLEVVDVAVRDDGGVPVLDEILDLVLEAAPVEPAGERLGSGLRFGLGERTECPEPVTDLRPINANVSTTFASGATPSGPVERICGGAVAATVWKIAVPSGARQHSARNQPAVTIQSSGM